MLCAVIWWRFYGSDGLVVFIELGAVWGSTVGHGSYSLDGRMFAFETRMCLGCVLGVVRGRRLASMGGAAVLHFGRSVASGSVARVVMDVLEAVSGESVSVSSQSVSVSAGSSLDVSGGDSVSVVSEVACGRVWFIRGRVICSRIVVCRRVAGRVQRWFGVSDEQDCSAESSWRRVVDVWVCGDAVRRVRVCGGEDVLEVSSAEMAVRAGDHCICVRWRFRELVHEDVAVSAGGSVSAFAGRCEHCE